MKAIDKYRKNEKIYEFEIECKPSPSLLKKLETFSTDFILIELKKGIICFAPLAEESPGWRIRVGKYYIYFTKETPSDEDRGLVLMLHRIMLNEGFYYPLKKDILDYWKNREEQFDQEKITHRNDLFYQLILKWLPEVESALEIGCRNGATLAFLKEKGIKQVAGIEIHEPKTQENFFCGDAETVIKKINNNAYDLVFSIGVLMHLHPDTSNEFWRDMVRVANKGIITIENEAHGSGLHWERNYGKLLEDHGAIELFSLKNSGENLLTISEMNFFNDIVKSEISGYTIRVFMKIPE